MAAGDEETGGLRLPEMEEIIDDAEWLSSDEVRLKAWPCRRQHAAAKSTQRMPDMILP